MRPLPASMVVLIKSQEGIVARWQALGLGMNEDLIRHKLDRGHWQICYPGVYATFTGPLSRRARLWAVILLCSKDIGGLDVTVGWELPEPDAVLSHETAAELHGLCDQKPGPIHVTVPHGRRKPRATSGIKVHLSTRLDAARHPVKLPPVTRVVDTVIDLTQSARTTDEAVSWLSRACGKRLTTPERLAAAIRERRKLRRRREVLYAVGDAAEGDHSLLEVRYHRNVERAHGLPTGKRQRRRVAASRIEYIDVVYREFGTISELDGRIGHEYEGKHRDMRRDNAAVVRGKAPLRYGWDDVDLEGCEVAVQVALVLRRNGWTGRPRPCGPGCAVEKQDPWR